MRFLNYFIAFAALLAFASCKQKEEAATFSNPLSVSFGDPFILKAGDGKFYMYGTGGRNGFRTYSSDDMVEWTDEGVIFEGGGPDSWGVDAYWAPEAYYINGKYYLLFSANWKHNPTNEGENFRIGFAVSDSPKGPFKEMSDAPLFDPGYPVIDGNLHFEEDGRVYLYYSRCCYKHPVESEIADWAREKGLFDEIEESWVYGVELQPDFSAIIGEPVLLLSPPTYMADTQAEWESRSVTSGEINRRWTEGSFTIKRDGKYYITYSANYYAGEHYAVGYAVGDAPLGPFVKADNNPILERNTDRGGIVTGTGHSMTLTLDNGDMWIVYHGRTEESIKTGRDRVVFMDRLYLKDGKLITDGPTTTPQPMPVVK